MAEERPSTTIPKWCVYLIIALIVVLFVTMVGQWWVRRPRRSAGHFISLLRKGQIDQASSMLHDTSSIQTDATGNLIIKARDSTTATLTPGELPVASHGPIDPAPRKGIGDYLVGRYRFQVRTVGPAVEGGQKKAVVVYCVVEADRIAIDTIRETVKGHGTTVWGFDGRELGPDGVPGIDYGAVAYAVIGSVPPIVSTSPETEDEAAFWIWMDSAVSSADGMSRGSFGSVIGSFGLGHGRRLDFRFEPRYGKGTVTVAGREYNCAEGRLFLTRDGREVKQLKRDPKELASMLENESRALSDVARHDPEISSFYQAHTQESGTSQAPNKPPNPAD